MKKKIVGAKASIDDSKSFRGGYAGTFCWSEFMKGKIEYSEQSFACVTLCPYAGECKKGEIKK